MADIATPSYAWIDGRFVEWDDCVVHVRSQAVMTGASAFEGIRAYWSAVQDELHVFRLGDHLRRLQDSMKVMRMTAPLAVGIAETCVELLAKNRFREDVHVIPVAYVGPGVGFGAMTKPMEEGCFITAVPRPQTRALVSGLHVRTSSWVRISDRSVPPRVKAAANYQNSRLAVMEARADGYDDAVLMNERGTVAEASGACIVMIRGGVVCTPSTTGGILESITRSTVITLFRERFDQVVVEREIDRTELYLADEVFICGSGHEITPVVSVDRIPVGGGKRGPVTQSIQDCYFGVVRGEDRTFPEWRTPVYGAKPALV